MRVSSIVRQGGFYFSVLLGLLFCVIDVGLGVGLGLFVFTLFLVIAWIIDLFSKTAG